VAVAKGIERRIERSGRGLDTFKSWLPAREAAERARLSKSHLLRLVRQGRGPAHVGAGRLMSFRGSDVDSWVIGGCR
jgi:excisionase family DNA binding protein